MRKRNYTPDCKEKIQSGEWKVETKSGMPCRIVCFDAKGGDRDDDLVVMVKGSLGSENIMRYYSDGTLLSCTNNEAFRLMVITDEPEPDMFERILASLTNNEIADEYTPFLKSLARKGYIESKPYYIQGLAYVLSHYDCSLPSEHKKILSELYTKINQADAV